MPWLEGASRVVVFHVKTNAKHGPLPQRIVNYLAAHGIKAEALEIAPDQRKIGQAVLDAGRDTGADLVVMGAYSSNRLRELILGGVTGYMFDKADRPLLMAH
jgi:nucleotide-binding universal stress UspA family protein